MRALLVMCLVSSSAFAAPQRVLVLDLRNDGVPDTTARLVRDAITTQIGKRPTFEVMSTEDLRRVAAVEADKQAAGCEDTSCLAEIAEALGADLVVHGSIGTLGSVIVVNLSLFDSARGRVAGRDTFSVDRPEQLPERLKASVDGLVGNVGPEKDGPKPPQAAHDPGGISGSVVIGGVTALVGTAGAIGLGGLALSMSDDLANPRASARNKQTALDWGVASALGATAAGIAAVTGAGLIVVGLVLDPP